MSFDAPGPIGPHGTGPSPLGEELLSAYLDDELDGATRDALEARLEESPEWRAVLDELTETRGALRALPSVDGSPEFWARVLAGDAVVDLGRERRARRRAIGWRAAIAGAAAAVVIVTLGVALVPQRERVKPAVATFADQHAARASLDNDAISQLASVGVPGIGR
jgi:anti-sigma factor RsiW